MRILFFPMYPITPFIEIDLELMKDHLQKGDEIFVCMCSRRLKTCLHNFNHRISYCIICQSRIMNALNAWGVPKDHIFSLPEITINYPRFPKFFQNTDELMSYKVDNLSLGIISASSLIYYINQDYNFNPKYYKKEITRQLRTDYYLYRVYSAILRQKKIDQAYIFNGRFSEFRIQVVACQKMNIPFGTFERAGCFGKYNLRINTIPHDLQCIRDEIEVLWREAPAEKREKIGNDYFINRRKGMDQGNYSFVKNQINGLIPQNIDKTKKIIGIFNSTIEEYVTVPEYYPTLFYKNELVALYHILKVLYNESDIQIFFRVHPNLRNLVNTQTRANELIKKKFPNIVLIDANSPINTYSLMEKCDLILTFTSTVGAEACFWGKASILFGAAIYDALNVAYQPKSYSELFQLMKRSLEPKDKRNAVKLGYWLSTFGTAFKYFSQKGIHMMTYKGKELNRISFMSKIVALFFRLLEVRQIKDLNILLRRISQNVVQDSLFS